MSLEVIMNVRVRSDEKQKWQKSAKYWGISLSEYVRRACNRPEERNIAPQGPIERGRQLRPPPNLTPTGDNRV